MTNLIPIPVSDIVIKNSSNSKLYIILITNAKGIFHANKLL